MQVILKFYKNLNFFKIKIVIIQTTGNIKLLSLGENKLYSRYLCQEHFPAYSLMNMTCKNSTLQAIPYKFSDVDDQPTSIVVST